MTNPTQWIAAALKILAAYLLIESITTLPVFAGSLAWALDSSPEPMARAARWGTIGSFVGLLMRLTIAVVLWRRSGALARQIWADAEPTTRITPGELTAERLQLIAFSLFGLYLLINVAPNLLEQVLTYRTYLGLPSDFAVDPQRNTQLLGGLLLTGGQIALGLWLLLYPDGFAALLRRLRDAITFADTERRKDDPDRGSMPD